MEVKRFMKQNQEISIRRWTPAGSENNNVLQGDILSQNWESVTPFERKLRRSPEVRVVQKKKKSQCKLPAISSQVSIMNNSFVCSTKKKIIGKYNGLVKNQSMKLVKMNAIVFPPIEIADNPSFDNKKKNFMMLHKHRNSVWEQKSLKYIKERFSYD